MRLPKSWAAALSPSPPAALAARAVERYASVPRPGYANARARAPPGGRCTRKPPIPEAPAPTPTVVSQDPEGLFKQEPQAGIIDQRLYFKAAAADQDFETKMEGFKKHQQEELDKKREVSDQ